MQYRIIGLALALSMVISTSHAKKSTPIPPNISSSANVAVTLRAEQLPPSVPLINGSLIYQISHSFEISGAQEAAIVEETTITILGVEFTPGEDPKFSNGDKSFNITKQLDISLAPGIETIPASIKGKWNNGKMSLSLKIAEKFKDVAPPIPLTAAARNMLNTLIQNGVVPTVTVAPRIENTAQIYSSIEHPSIPTAEFVSNMTADVSMSQTEAATAEGAQIQEVSQSVKTKLYTAPSMP